VDEGVDVGGMGVGAEAHPLIVSTSRESIMNTKRPEVFIFFLLLIGLRQIVTTMFMALRNLVKVGRGVPLHFRLSFPESQKTVFQRYGSGREQRKPMS